MLEVQRDAEKPCEAWRSSRGRAEAVEMKEVERKVKEAGREVKRQAALARRGGRKADRAN